LPTIADVAARRREVLKAALREQIATGNLAPFKLMVNELAAEFDPVTIAAAAAKLAMDGDRPLTEMIEIEDASDGVEPGMVRLFLNIGRASGVRPGDIVGAIANEAGLPGRAIGAIDIYDTTAFVEVPGAASDRVIQALQRTTIKGQQVQAQVAGPRLPPPRDGQPPRRTDDARPARSKPATHPVKRHVHPPRHHPPKKPPHRPGGPR
jgi:ATP-dependent RNA helicase DeaD